MLEICLQNIHNIYITYQSDNNNENNTVVKQIIKCLSSWLDADIIHINSLFKPNSTNLMNMNTTLFDVICEYIDIYIMM